MATLALARAYQLSFASHPHATLAVAGGCLTALGDIVAQFTQHSQLVRKDDELHRYDFLRTVRFFCFGFTMSPVMGKWNSFLEHRFPLRSTKGSDKVSFRALSKRVACDQLVMAPIGLGLFLGSMGMMEGRTSAQIQDKYKDLYTTALVANWRVWPLAQFVNFRYMPLLYRVPFAQTCGIAWTLYLSLLNSKEDDKCSEQQDKRAEGTTQTSPLHCATS